ncbi:hypothetical protein CK203_102739 [Vitis vinifera]|uniref:Uncharacterized protein n=1 Tax=Vitis vinifera TaxID=29760 RepID=A0A438C6A6_VITVI|nr:hypothetical protein CK203_102739 [Vitis vinifera]
MGLERERGSFSGLVELSPREAKASLNPLFVMLRDGSTAVLTEAPGPGLENNVAKQRESSADPPCEEGWSEEELFKLTHFSKVLECLSKGMKLKFWPYLRN